MIDPTHKLAIGDRVIVKLRAVNQLLEETRAVARILGVGRDIVSEANSVMLLLDKMIAELQNDNTVTGAFEERLDLLGARCMKMRRAMNEAQARIVDATIQAMRSLPGERN